MSDELTADKVYVEVVIDLQEQLEAARVEASDLAGALQRMTADRDAWIEMATAHTRRGDEYLAAHAERSAKVAELEQELDAWKAMHARMVLPVVADYLRKRGDSYRRRALALLKQVAHHRRVARVRAIGNEALDVAVNIVTREKARADAAEQRVEKLAALREWLELIRKGIDPEIGDDGLKDETILAMIDAALAGSPAPNRGGGTGETSGN